MKRRHCCYYYYIIIIPNECIFIVAFAICIALYEIVENGKTTCCRRDVCQAGAELSVGTTTQWSGCHAQ